MYRSRLSVEKYPDGVWARPIEHMTAQHRNTTFELCAISVVHSYQSRTVPVVYSC